MPATAASAAPITKVSEMVRSTSTPSSDAIFRSCSQARMSRPSGVLAISHEKPAISTSVTSTMMIWMLEMSHVEAVARRSACEPPVMIGGSGLTRAPCAICT